MYEELVREGRGARGLKSLLVPIRSVAVQEEEKLFCLSSECYLLQYCGDEEKHAYLSDSRTTPILEKRKVLLKLTFGKILILTDVLHVPLLVSVRKIK